MNEAIEGAGQAGRRMSRRDMLKAASAGAVAFAATGALTARAAAPVAVSSAEDDGSYAAGSTGLLIVDPYNDFMTEKGKAFDATRASREKYKSLENMRLVIGRARETGIQVFIVPHHRSVANDYAGFRFMNPTQVHAHEARIFERGTWGGEFNPEFGPKAGDVVINEHWSASGFATTDLDMQLKQMGISKIVLIGMIANTCIESTARYGVELGYHVTLVTDAVAAFSLEGMHAFETNGPTYAHAVVSTAELLTKIRSRKG